MGDTWWVIIICPCVNVFSLMGGVTEADVGFPTVPWYKKMIEKTELIRKKEKNSSNLKQGRLRGLKEG
jgi:hypothetical protein